MTDVLDIEQLLRDAAPVPREEFVRSLDTRAARGFRTPAPSAKADPIWPWERPLWRLGAAWRNHTWVRGSLAVAASTILVLAVVTATSPTDGGGDGTRSAKQQGRDTGGYQELSARDYTAVPLAEEGLAPTRTDVYTAGRVEYDSAKPRTQTRVTTSRTGSSTVSVSGTINDYRRYLLGSGLFLTATPKQVPDVVADAVDVARDLDGYPGSSTFDVKDGTATGTADLWVPTDSYAEAMSRLSKLGDVERTVQNSRDVTASRADLVQQIRDDRERISEFGHVPGRTRDDPQLEALRNQLELRRQRLADLDRRVEMTLINLRVRGVEPEPEVRERWTIDWALHEGVELIGRMAAAIILLASALLIPAAIALVAWFGWRARRHRLRDRALDDE